MNKIEKWIDDPLTWADSAHLFGACTVVTTGWVLSNWRVGLVVQVVLIIFALGKEYWYDLKDEEGETIKSSRRDFLGYVAGSILAWAIYFIHMRRLA